MNKNNIVRQMYDCVFGSIQSCAGFHDPSSYDDGDEEMLLVPKNVFDSCTATILANTNQLKQHVGKKRKSSQGRKIAAPKKGVTKKRG